MKSVRRWIINLYIFFCKASLRREKSSSLRSILIVFFVQSSSQTSRVCPTSPSLSELNWMTLCFVRERMMDETVRSLLREFSSCDHHNIYLNLEEFRLLLWTNSTQSSSISLQMSKFHKFLCYCLSILTTINYDHVVVATVISACDCHAVRWAVSELC